MSKENQLETADCGAPVKNNNNEELAAVEQQQQRYSTDSDSGLPTCRVCHSTESDKRGDAALGSLGITPPLVPEAPQSNADQTCDDDASKATEANDIEMGIQTHQKDSLLELGCSCKNELALVHYACALKWFLNHGSTVCEICGNPAENIKTGDVSKVVTALRDHTALRERTDPNSLLPRKRLSEISSWFGPHNNNSSSSVAASQAVSEQPSGVVSFDVLPMENRATKWAVEGTGILLATGLLTVTLVWLIAPRVDKKTARSGVHILLGGLCALIVVIFFRFVVLTRIRYGPARYWVILFIFWFLVFAVWASRSNAHNVT